MYVERSFHSYKTIAINFLVWPILHKATVCYFLYLFIFFYICTYMFIAFYFFFSHLPQLCNKSAADFFLPFLYTKNFVTSSFLSWMFWIISLNIVSTYIQCKYVKYVQFNCHLTLKFRKIAYLNKSVGEIFGMNL